MIHSLKRGDRFTTELKRRVAFGSVSAGYLSGLCRGELSMIFIAAATA